MAEIRYHEAFSSYGTMLSSAIRPPSTVKCKASVTGLPGKEPETVIATLTMARTMKDPKRAGEILESGKKFLTRTFVDEAST